MNPLELWAWYEWLWVALAILSVPFFWLADRRSTWAFAVVRQWSDVTYVLAMAKTFNLGDEVDVDLVGRGIGCLRSTSLMGLQVWKPRDISLYVTDTEAYNYCVERAGQLKEKYCGGDDAES